MPMLPVEIAEAIIGILAEDDPDFSSTKACALACHNFLHLCRRHIFASIALNNDGQSFDRPLSIAWVDATTYQLQQLLDATPEIGDHIRNLHFCVAPSDLENESFSLLAQAFKTMTRLKFLSIRRSNIPRLGWDDICIRPLLLLFCQLPTLVRLRLSFILNFSITDLALCVNLEQFEFQALHFATQSEDTQANLPESGIRSIRYLSVGNNLVNTEAIMKLCAAHCVDRKPFLDFSVLTNLSLTISALASHHMKPLHTLFGLCNRLMDVRIRVTNSKANLNQIGLFNMLRPSMETLRHLFVATIYNERTGSNDPYCGLSFQLQEMKHANIIETIAIEVSISPDSNCRRGDEWGRLDAALAQSRWPMLEQVSLKICIQNTDRADDELQRALEKLPQTQFLKLSSSKTVQFHFGVYEEHVPDPLKSGMQDALAY